jgi:hypothetical protein
VSGASGRRPRALAVPRRRMLALLASVALGAGACTHAKGGATSSSSVSSSPSASVVRLERTATVALQPRLAAPVGVASAPGSLDVGFFERSGPGSELVIERVSAKGEATTVFRQHFDVGGSAAVLLAPRGRTLWVAVTLLGSTPVATTVEELSAQGVVEHAWSTVRAPGGAEEPFLLLGGMVASADDAVGLGEVGRSGVAVRFPASGGAGTLHVLGRGGPPSGSSLLGGIGGGLVRCGGRLWALLGIRHEEVLGLAKDLRPVARISRTVTASEIATSTWRSLACAPGGSLLALSRSAAEVVKGASSAPASLAFHPSPLRLAGVSALGDAWRAGSGSAAGLWWLLPVPHYPRSAPAALLGYAIGSDHAARLSAEGRPGVLADQVAAIRAGTGGRHLFVFWCGKTSCRVSVFSRAGSG